MAIEQTPLELDLRDPRRRRREFNSLLWLCGWGGLTAVALTILAITTQTETANERLRRIFAINESSRSRECHRACHSWSPKRSCWPRRYAG